MNSIMSIFFYFFSLVCFISFSQSKDNFATVKVLYSVELNLDKNQEINRIHEKYSPGLISRAESTDSEIEFTLIFNDSISIFYLEKKLFSDNRSVSFVLNKASYFGRIRQQPQNYITEELEEDFGKFLVSRSYQEWKLLDETKMIGDYLCFKATTFYLITNSQGKVFKHQLSAWYTPQLPYKFGPAGYGNLPGLIIELQGKSITYGVKKIEFFVDNEQTKEIEMPELKRKKLITEEEFEALAAKDEKRWRDKQN